MANKVMGYVICGYNSVDNLMSDQSSPFRRWTTGSGAGSSYRHHDHRNMYNKQISEGSANNGGVSGGAVTRWALGLEQLLADPAGAAAFAHFLSLEVADENIKFWWSCEEYAATVEEERRGALAAKIWEQHLGERAPEPVNVDAAARRAAHLRLHHKPSPPDLFHQAQKQIFNVMKFDSYPRFLRSSVHAECARAELCGLPLPYQPAQSPKLKKSASNASERRRSGGALLLPWKMRATSRERTQPPTDVVKSNGTGQLCRVVLPDGATSVVGVEPALTVRALVERLLQRRNLHCAAYDVLFKDAQKGESSMIDVSMPSTVLGGREVRVEWRVVVRVEMGGKCVVVRCGRGKRLRHVLRPVLAKYCAPGSAPRVVLRDGVQLHPDTLMQDLDEARLQIQEVVDHGDCNGSDRFDDDCLADLALRLQDDADTQSISVSSSSSRSRGDLGSGSSALSNGDCDGRVRAALRPGPPLHHHPPDFLENLRETQRQRLQSKPEAAPSGAPASPRAPPPLPPKPPQRATPTVV